MLKVNHFQNNKILIALLISFLFLSVPLLNIHADEASYEACLGGCTQISDPRGQVATNECALDCEVLLNVSGGILAPVEGGVEGLRGTEFDNPIGTTREVQDVIGNVIKAVLGLVGVAALVMFTYGGILWMTAAGSQDRIRMGRDTLKWAIIGLVVVFTSYAIVNFALTAFGGGG